MEHNMSVDWHRNAERAKETVWVVKVYQHDKITGKTALISVTGAPTEELAHRWAEMTVNFWRGGVVHLPGPNATFFVPDVYIVPQKTYTYSIKQEKGEIYEL